MPTYKTLEQKDGFAFLVHPRDVIDIYRKYPFAKIFPQRITEWLFGCLRPVIVSEIDGLKNKDGKKIKGWVISVPLTAQQMMKDRDLAKKKIIQSVRLAEKLGVTIVGLGALTASLTRGGLDLTEIFDIGITTGRAYTVKTIVSYAELISGKLEINLQGSVVAVVGAAGGIGSACVKVLANKGVKKFILVDLERKKDLLNEIVQDIKKNFDNSDVVFTVSSDVRDICDAGFVIAATNTPDVVIGPDDLKSGAIVINDAQPSDISPEIFKKRRDVLIVEGGIIHTPGIKYNFNFGLAEREDSFSCLGEVMILSASGWKYNYATGHLDLSLIDDITKMSKNMGFGPAKIQNFVEGVISEEKLNKIKKIWYNR